MFSRRFYSLLDKVFPFISGCGVSKYCWDSKSGLFVVNVQNRYISYYHVSIHLISIMFNIFQMIRFHRAGRLEDLILLFGLTTGFIFAAFTNAIFVCYSKQFFLLVNMGLVLLRRLNRKFDKSLKKYIIHNLVQLKRIINCSRFFPTPEF